MNTNNYERKIKKQMNDQDSVVFNKNILHAIKCMEFFSELKYLFLLKGTNGEILYMTDFAAKVYGLDQEPDNNLSYIDTFKQKHLNLNEQFIELDKSLLNSPFDISFAITFYEYTDKIPARLTIRHKFLDSSSNIAGIIHQEIPADLHNPGIMVINSIIGNTTFTKHVEENTYAANTNNNAQNLISKLSEYEYEICFLLSLDWALPKIRKFMLKLDPNYNSSLDAIIKKKNAICKKLAIEPADIAQLQTKLFQCQMYKHIPDRLLKHLKGSYLIRQ